MRWHEQANRHRNKHKQTWCFYNLCTPFFFFFFVFAHICLVIRAFSSAALFVAGCHSLKPKILKALNPSQSDRPLCCISLLGAAIQSHCVFVLCGHHAALLSCIHIGFLTVQTGGCCSPDTYFPQLKALAWDWTSVGHGVKAGQAIWCGCTEGSAVLGSSSRTPLFCLLTRSAGSTWLWMKATVWKTTTVSWRRFSTPTIWLHDESSWQELHCRISCLSSGHCWTSSCPPFSRVAALSSNGSMPLSPWLEKRLKDGLWAVVISDLNLSSERRQSDQCQLSLVFSSSGRSQWRRDHLDHPSSPQGAPAFPVTQIEEGSGGTASRKGTFYST